MLGHETKVAVGLGHKNALIGEDMSDLCRAYPERNRPERAVRAGMAIAANNRHAGLRRAELWPHDMNNTAVVTVPTMRFNIIGLCVSDQKRDLGFGCPAIKSQGGGGLGPCGEDEGPHHSGCTRPCPLSKGAAGADLQGAWHGHAHPGADDGFASTAECCGILNESQPPLE